MCLLDPQFKMTLYVMVLKLRLLQGGSSKAIAVKMKELSQRQDNQNIFLFSSNNLECVFTILTAVRDSIKRGVDFHSSNFDKVARHEGQNP
mmetsp:Transcript_14192/g.24124  ORF Transcript_14192/g.24124 Transcript_14192/m.24124 type:complete len:91 (-) Transcript_14192:1653-1925(-)